MKVADHCWIVAICPPVSGQHAPCQRTKLIGRDLNRINAGNVNAAPIGARNAIDQRDDRTFYQLQIRWIESEVDLDLWSQCPRRWVLTLI